MAVFINELRGIRPVGQGCGNAVSLHADRDVVADFEMQVCGIHSEVGADCADFLAAFDGLAVLHEDFVQVAVEGVDVFDFPGGWIGDEKNAFTGSLPLDGLPLVFSSGVLPRGKTSFLNTRRSLSRRTDSCLSAAMSA